MLKFFASLAACLVGIEACATSHYWSRQWQAFGHSVKLMPPAYVSPTLNAKNTTCLAARAGGTPLGFADGSRILGGIHLKDTVKLDSFLAAATA